MKSVCLRRGVFFLAGFICVHLFVVETVDPGLTIGCGRFQLGDGVSRSTPQVRVGWRTAIFTATENAASSFLWWSGVSGMAHAQGSRRGTGRSTGFQLTRIIGSGNARSTQPRDTYVDGHRSANAVFHGLSATTNPPADIVSGLALE
ncbi:hypothetical protein E4T39_08645 [Aureobasidium subglaciale]|nr:hypothetical protein E4T39_08645 [Aureobasidium subglaciale]